MSEIEVTSNQPTEQKTESSEEVKQSASSVKQDEISEESDASNESVETEVDETEESKDETSNEDIQDEEKKSKKSGFKKRIDKLSKRATEAEERAEYWRQQALKGQPVKQETQQVDENPKAEVHGKPNLDHYESYAEYTEALTDWKIEQREAAKIAKEREERVKADYQKSVTSFQEKIITFKESHSDFEDVIDDVSDIALPFALREELTTSELGPQLMYELSKDRDELERISKLTDPKAIAREVGKFEARLEKSSESSKTEIKKQTSAPPPPKPIGSSKAPVKKSIYDADLSQSEYEALRREQMRKKA